MDEEGWVVPEYANSTYLIFEKTEGALVYRVRLMENDCYPGDEVFTEDLKRALEKTEKRMEGDDWLKIIGEVEETEDRKIVYEMAKEVTEAYFQGAEPVTINGIKGMSNVQEEIGGKCTVQVEFLAAGEDSLTYLSMIFEKKETGWEISSYGLEK